MIYIARKYFLQALEEECISQLKSQIQPDTVIEILHVAHVYDLTPLSEACWEYISYNPTLVLKVSGASIDLDLLKSILRLPKLDISEVKLFIGVKEWARNVCDRNPTSSDDTTGLSIRKTLGEALKLIRFETMQPEEIATEVAPTGILTLSELGSIFICINTPEDAAVPAPVLFNNVPRERPDFFASSAGSDLMADMGFGSGRANRRSRRRSAARRNQNHG